MFRTQGTTYERALMVDMNLGEVARIVENVDLFTDKGSKGWLDVAPSHKADAVTPDFA